MAWPYKRVRCHWPLLQERSGNEASVCDDVHTYTIHAFHLYGFEVMAIVLDGASTNLAAMKYFTMGKAGAYGMNEDPAVSENLIM